MNFNSILIGSENPDRLREYYTKLFGEPKWDDGGYFGWLLGNGAVTIGPHDQVKGNNKEPGRLIWNIEAPDVEGQFKKLKAAGATVVKEPYNPDTANAASEFRIATLADPDGNYFQLMSPMPEAMEASREMSREASRA
jgi:predicted enzyme related to lactoylglutathione lyase